MGRPVTRMFIEVLGQCGPRNGLKDGNGSCNLMPFGLLRLPQDTGVPAALGEAVAVEFLQERHYNAAA